jgi:hypothetical protein
MRSLTPAHTQATRLEQLQSEMIAANAEYKDALSQAGKLPSISAN